MKCFISYRRDNADAINGEALMVSQRYNTFDKAEMDRLEDFLKSSIGCGVSEEYDIDKCIENAKEEKLMEQVKEDPTNPDHYKNQTSLECIEAMEIIFGRDAVIDFCRCNAWKYIWRWKNKNGTEDLKKAKWYLQRAFNMLDGSDKRMDIVRGMIHYIGWSVEDKVEESDG